MVVACLAVMSLTVAGCGGSSGGGSGDGPVMLTFRQFDPPSETGGLQAAVAAWNSSHSNVQVKMETLGGDNAAQQFAREANSGSGPDVVQIANVNVKDLAKPKILMPLDSMAAKSPPETPVDQYLALDLARFGAKTWALPWTVDTYALAYRPADLKAAGLQPPTTWPELATEAAKLSTSGKSRSGFCFPGASGPGAGQWFPINYYLWSHQPALVKNVNGTWQVGVSQAQLASTIDYFNSLFTSRATAKSFIAVEDMTDPQIVNGLVQGTCAMTMMPPQTFRQARGDDKSLLTAPMPDGLMDGATHLGGRMLGINASTKHPQQAWDFIRYLNSSDAFTHIDQYPAARTVLNKMKVPAGEQGFQQQLPHAVTFGKYIAGPVPVTTLQKITNAQFGAVYSGQKDSQAAAQTIISQIQSELSARS